MILLQVEFGTCRKYVLPADIKLGLVGRRNA